MRLNAFVAQATGCSRRRADELIRKERVFVNNQPGQLGQMVGVDDKVTLESKVLKLPIKPTTILVNKPVGYVCSRSGQGSKTIYNLLPPHLHHLKLIGRLDKDSSGLLLLTSNGKLAHQLTHPSFQKQKVYEVEIDKPLRKADFQKIIDDGVDIGDKHPSQFQLRANSNTQQAKSEDLKTPTYFLASTNYWRATLIEGRNRQVRRTFLALDYKVVKLHRTQFGLYQLGKLPIGNWLLT